MRKTVRPAAPGGLPEKSGAVLHHLVTTGSVKKALKIAKLRASRLDRHVPAGQPLPPRSGGDEVMRPAHTPPKCSTEVRQPIALRAPRENSDQDIFEKVDCRSLAGFEY
jgi:hypothetical protein